MFIDLEFKRWLRDAIGPRNYNMLDPTAGANGDQRIYPYAAEVSICPMQYEVSRLTRPKQGGALRSLIRQFEAQKKLFQGLPGDIKLDMPPPLNKLTIDGRVREGELTITRYVLMISRWQRWFLADRIAGTRWHKSSQNALMVYLH